jgi:hypothetical protein
MIYVFLFCVCGAALFLANKWLDNRRYAAHLKHIGEEREAAYQEKYMQQLHEEMHGDI